MCTVDRYRLTPDSQKSTTEQGSEKLSSLGDKAAGSLQPGDSKSTTQEASDKARSGADDTQDTLKGLSNQASDTFNNASGKVSENLPSGGEAKDTGNSYLNQAQGLASDAQKKLSESTPSSGEAQDTGKTYLQQGQELASNAAKVVSDTLTGMSRSAEYDALTEMMKLTRSTDAANKISESSNTGSK